MASRQNDRAKNRAEGLRPFKDQPLHKRAMPDGEGKGNPPRDPDDIRRQSPGPAVWHGVNPTRFAAPLPSSSKGPIRSRENRKAKGLPGY